MAETAINPARTSVEPLDVATTPAQAAVIFGRDAHCCILESSLPDSTYGRYSIFAAEPIDTLDVAHTAGADALDELFRALAGTPSVSVRNASVPCGCGWLGFLTYESGLGTEGLRPATAWPNPLPLIHLGLYDAVAVFDHTESKWYAASADVSSWRRTSGSRADRVNRIRSRLEAGRKVSPVVAQHPGPVEFVAQTSPHDYLHSVARTKAYIDAGDVYQVNLTQRWDVQTAASPLETYLRLRRESPSPHAAFIRFGENAVLSASPELLVRLRDGHIVTRPIKGTRPRFGMPELDRESRADLAASAKDRAELNMIIDLMRNDIGRVGELGSVRVVDPNCIETHPTLYHRVATVAGSLAADMDRADLVRAVLPGGSVTGAPKIRAMQIIDELETVARGPYCGAIGWIGLDGSMTLNVAIRTMTQLRGKVFVHAGGAIVADSDPQDEYDETLVKAAAMFRALGAPVPKLMRPRRLRETSPA